MDHQDPFAGGLAPSHAPFTAPTSQRFGPYLGMTRMERCVCNHGAGGRATLTPKISRWQRAERNGLSPPSRVRDLLLSTSEKHQWSVFEGKV